MDLEYVKRRSGTSLGVLLTASYIDKVGEEASFENLMEGFRFLYGKTRKLDEVYREMELPSGLPEMPSEDEVKDAIQFLVDESMLLEEKGIYSITPFGRTSMELAKKIAESIEMYMIKKHSGLLYLPGCGGSHDTLQGGLGGAAQVFEGAEA